ncbi:terminase [Cyanobacteria bacterium FACHB-63]|nr:terminase [Cyanobacteria bacterium FACHB-63]
MPVRISEFARDRNLLNTPLWDKQSEILETFFTQQSSIGVWALGRRSGKTLMAAIAAVYAGTMLADAYKKYLRSGEKFYIITVANTIDQARIALGNIKDLVNGSPILKPMIERETADTLELSHGCVFRAMPASSRSGRGMACPFIIFDELAFAIDTDGNQSGSALYQALAPSTAQFGKLGKILLLSSPWIQQGIFWDLFQQARSGKFAYMQAVQLPSWEVNPTLSPDFLAQEKARDPEMFAIEYGAEFSGSINAFLNSDVIEAAVNRSRSALAPMPKYRGNYVLSLDPAKGGRDAYTACIVHYESDRLVLDLWHEFQPTWTDGKKLQIDVAAVENWILEQHKRYGFKKVILDQYNSQSTIQRLQRQIRIEESTWTAQNKTQAFSKLRELFHGNKIDLYPHTKGIEQLKNLIVRYRTNGTWDVSGGAGAAVDDYAMSLAGAVLVSSPQVVRRSAAILAAPLSSSLRF